MSNENERDILPDWLEEQLSLVGLASQAHKTEPKVERDFTFKMPLLDENGEPPW